MGAAKEKKTAAELEKAKLKGKQDAGRETERSGARAEGQSVGAGRRRAPRARRRAALRATVEELSRDLDRAKAEWATKLRGEEDGVQALSAARARARRSRDARRSVRGRRRRERRAAAEEREAGGGGDAEAPRRDEGAAEVDRREGEGDLGVPTLIELQQNARVPRAPTAGGGRPRRAPAEAARAGRRRLQVPRIQAQVDDLNRKIEKARIEEAKTKGALER